MSVRRLKIVPDIGSIASETFIFKIYTEEQTSWFGLFNTGWSTVDYDYTTKDKLGEFITHLSTPVQYIIVNETRQP